MTPGVAVFPAVLASIDTNADGVLSDAEQRTYAERVLRDLSFAVDGSRSTLRLLATKFASITEMQDGRGEIQIAFEAAVPTGGGDRQLAFENRHAPNISVYLVNALVSTDPDIRFTHQSRNYDQSSYRMHYAQAGVHPASAWFAWWPLCMGVLGVALAVSAMRFMPRIPPFATRT